MDDQRDEKIQVHVPYPLLSARFSEVLGLGINPEIYIDGADLEAPERGFLDQVRGEFSSRGLRITQHGPYLGLNPASIDEDKRLFTVKKYQEAFNAAEAMGAVNIVLHAGYDKKTFAGNVDHWMERGMKTWPEFVRRAEDADITIAAENIFDDEPAPLKRLVEEIGSPRFRLCIDSGHLNVYSKVGFEPWFKELAPYIAELHLHDNVGKRDEHLPLGDGSIDFKEYFGFLKKYDVRPIYTIEPHNEGSFERALCAARNFVTRMAE